MKLNLLSKLGFGTLAAISVIASVSSTAQAQEKQNFSYTTECTSKGTELSGKRKKCYSAWSTNTLPSGFVFNKDLLKYRYTSKNGSENRCEFEWADYVEIVPGTDIKMPRTLKIRAYARSPKHDRGARGWSKCLYTGQYVSIVNN